MKDRKEKPSSGVYKTCPNCNGPLNRESEDAVVICQFCGSSLLLDLDGWHCVFRHDIVITREKIPLYVRNHFSRIPGAKEPKIIDFETWLLPFWQGEKKHLLVSANSSFPLPVIAKPSANPCSYNQKNDEAGKHLVADIDQSPKNPEEKIPDLVFLPFYKISLENQGKQYFLLLDAINGKIHGDLPFPAEMAAYQRKLFHFAASFVFFLVVFMIVGNPLAAVMIGLMYIFVSFFPSFRRKNRFSR